MSDKKVSKAKKKIAKTDKKIPKIRIVTLDKKSPAEKGDKQDKGCCKEVCPPCANEWDCGCMCVRVEPPSCTCVGYVPPCSCVDHVTPPSCSCQYEVPCSNKTIPSNPKSGNNQKGQQTPKEGKGKPRTFFKIAENKK